MVRRFIAAASLGWALAAAAGSSAAVLPVQRLEAPPRGAPSAKLESEHFDITYNPEVLKREGAEAARGLAEKAWETCRQRFGSAPGSKIELDLTPLFRGATGFARPTGPRGPREPMIGVRYSELDYLGLSGEYVLTHEVAHVFSGELAGGSLGEGIADWGAGTYSGLPMSQWWGRALQQAELWIDPEAFFITGDFEPTPEVNSLIRTAQYAESALLVRYLVDRFGWARFRSFAEAYSEARGRLESNSDRARQPSGPRRRRAAPPNRDAVLAVFTRQLGESWANVRSDWERQMREDPASATDMRRLVLGQSIYGTIRNYEMWALEQEPGPGARTEALVREAFTSANRLLRAGDLSGAESAFARAKAVVEQLRRPQDVARATSWGILGAATFAARVES